MSVSEVNSGPQGSGCWQGQGQGRAPVGAYAHPGLDGRKPVITSELRHPECHPRLGCRVVREPVQRPREVPCSARGGECPLGKGTQPHGRLSSRWESGRQSSTPSSQELGTREAVSVPCSTRDAPCSWGSFLSRPGWRDRLHHSQATRRLRPALWTSDLDACLLCGGLPGIAAPVLARLLQTRSPWSSSTPAPQRPTLDSRVAGPQRRVHWSPCHPCP